MVIARSVPLGTVINQRRNAATFAHASIQHPLRSQRFISYRCEPAAQDIASRQPAVAGCTAVQQNTMSQKKEQIILHTFDIRKVHDHYCNSGA